jgi:hypothetical protein
LDVTVTVSRLLFCTLATLPRVHSLAQRVRWSPEPLGTFPDDFSGREVTSFLPGAMMSAFWQHVDNFTPNFKVKSI